MTVIELGGIGPGPFCSMVLADLGAHVIRVVKPGSGEFNPVLDRGRTAIEADLKSPAGAALVHALLARSDAVIEGFRPGVAERLGFGPDALQSLFPSMVVGRVTGFGRSGPLADRAGHDINYIALSGTLHSIGRSGERPVVPLNLLGDYGGGGMLLAVGMVAALRHSALTGVGQVVDTAMVDGSALLMALIHGMSATGDWLPERGSNLVDTGAPFYDTYECADGKFVAVGALEPVFFAQFVDGLGLTGHPVVAHQNDRSTWPAMREEFTAAFKLRTRDAWEARFEGRDACVTPVLSVTEAAAHPHNAARGVFMVASDGAQHPAPAPRFSATPLSTPVSAGRERLAPAEVLRGLGYAEHEIAKLFQVPAS
ncbi:CaiB/BaiF CoA transferase family protein [Streptomyces sp. NPDC101225]|uniref:CaiB/BaiF CoA transferase family protein n=1 Tax=Streptomyces sp. NPDC101225 TaxID=3366135 RepID=UPI00380690FD